jgi:hypothetical protein
MISISKSNPVSKDGGEDRVSNATIRVLFDGSAFKTVHWSLSTFVIDAYDGSRRPGDEIVVRGVAPERGSVKAVEFRARVVHFDDRKWKLEAVIVDMDDEDRETLQGLNATEVGDGEAVRRALAS